jgi:FAD/FMN-containing dehydrogenase
MSGNAARLRQSGRYRSAALSGPVLLRPSHTAELKRCMNPESQYAAPFRPMGANSSATDCATSTGTVIDLTGLDRILKVDIDRGIVAVQPGVRIGTLVEELAEYGYELAGGHDLMSRTVGGAVAGGSIGPTFGDEGALLASQVESLKIVTPDGSPIVIRRNQEQLMHAFRLSFGMLGVIYEIRLRIRPIRNFAVAHRSCSFDQFGGVAEKLAAADVGLKFFLMPFRDRVYLDIRRHSLEATASHRIPWKMKDWGESTVLPNVVKSLNILVPISSMRYRLIDQFSKVTQGLVNNSLVSTGSNATALPGTAREDTGNLHYSTWFFPAADFAIVVQAYREFCLRTHASTGFRCDLPTAGFRVGQDGSALLSPSFEEPMIALRALSTQAKGWDDFVIDFSEFARHWGGSPLFNQTREVPAEYPLQVFGSRYEFFRKIRRHFDPENRMMNPYLSQYFL